MKIFKRLVVYLTFLLLIMVGLTGCVSVDDMNTATVSFDSLGGTSVTAESVEVGTVVSVPIQPTKFDSVFDGWYTDTAYTNEWIFISDIILEDITLYAKWKAATYTVTYDGNDSTGGTVPVDNAGYTNGQEVTVLGNTENLVKLQYGISLDFIGWTNSSGITYTNNDTFNVGFTNVTLYAKWSTNVLRHIGPAGGFVFYDKGSYSEGWRFLEAAPSNTEWTDKQWSSNTNEFGVINATIGSGQTNTTSIVAWLNSHEGIDRTNRAAWLCNELSITTNSVTYDDWFLPSLGELEKIHDNLFVSNVGSFSGEYWSSSEREIEPDMSYLYVFDSPSSQTHFYKNMSHNVRAVRSF